MKTLLILQIIAHVMSDFNFQPQRWCDAKTSIPKPQKPNICL